MNTTTKKVIKFFFAWQDEQEEAFLTDMARQGWHLTRVGWGNYTFEAGAPKNIVYRLDYLNQSNKTEKQQYLQLFTDAGWDYFGEYNSWQYFRKEVQPGEVGEIFTDRQSKVAKYQRNLTYMAMTVPIYFVVIFNPLYNNYSGGIFTSIRAALFLFLILYAVIFWKLIQRINDLKKQK